MIIVIDRPKLSPTHLSLRVRAKGVTSQQELAKLQATSFTKSNSRQLSSCLLEETLNIKRLVQASNPHPAALIFWNFEIFGNLHNAFDFYTSITTTLETAV